MFQNHLCFVVHICTFVISLDRLYNNIIKLDGIDVIDVVECINACSLVDK